MNWITDDIAIGNYLDARDADALRDAGVRSAVSLDGSLKGYALESLPYEEVAHFNLTDGPGNDSRIFHRALGTLERLRESHAPVLVHCHAGRSRSVVLVTAYLMRSKGLHLEEALEYVTSRREAALTPGIEELFDLV